MKMSVDQALRKARSLTPDEAKALYQEILERFPANKRVRAELEALSRPVIVNPSQEALEVVVAPYRLGQHAQALDLAADLLTRFPNSEILQHITGAIQAALGRFDQAVGHYDAAIALAPDYFEAFNSRGNALVEQGLFDDAVASFDAALKLNPDYPEAHMNRGIALRRSARLAESLASYERSIRLNPNCAEAYNNRGNTLLALHRREEAIADYDKAIALKAGFADPFINRGNAYTALNRPDAAVESYDRAVALAPNNVLAHRSRGGALLALGRLDEALDAHAQAFQLAPRSALSAAEIRHVQQRMCLWAGGMSGGMAPMGFADDAVPPFYMLGFADDPRRQLQAASIWTTKEHARARPGDVRRRPVSGKIRIGYFSADFHEHATMRLLARTLELHDKARFEIHAFSYGPEVDDAMRRRLLASVDGFHAVGALSDPAVAELARKQGIDIAVDLKGHTRDGRPGIFAHRAAAVQVNYLGYPGSMGAGFIDHIIADPVTIPAEAQGFFAEKVAYLPNCYQPNDDSRPIADRAFSRAELGLPEQGFVFCCFNNNYKITAKELDIWARLLARVEGSVLWLLQDNVWAADNLRREAAARGIAPERLIFAERLPQAEHLARQRQADLFLDTFDVNAHTTASDALWAGLPVVTKLGKSFVARVAGSLVHAVGLPELATDSAEAYEALALDLASDPAKLAALKEKLAHNLRTSPLFDSAGYTRDLENLFTGLMQAG